MPAQSGLSVSGRLLRSTLAIRPHSKPRRLVVPQMPVGLLPYRSAGTTRKKSPAPTTLCASAPAHRRRWDGSCGTRLLAEKHPLPPVSSSDAQTKRPARTALRAPAWFFVSPAPTTASESQIQGVAAPLGRLLPAASA